MRKTKTSGIYAIINKVNGKIYIGSSCCLEARKARHFNELRKNKHLNIYLQNAFNKYGEENLEWKVLKLCKRENLLKEEQIFMYKYNCTNRDCGYNIMLKSNCSLLSEETQLKLSKIRKGKTPWNKGKKMSKEICAKNRMSHLGIKLSKETRLKMSKKIFTDEHRKNLSKSLRGRICSIETREKIRKKHKGMKYSKETRLKMGLAKRKYTHLFLEWKKLKEEGLNLREISKKYNICETTISNYFKYSLNT